MQNVIKGLMLVAFAGVLSGCASTEEEVVFVEPDPVPAEPTYTGKYK